MSKVLGPVHITLYFASSGCEKLSRNICLRITDRMSLKVTINVIILKVDGDLADFGAPSTYFIFQEEKQ